MDHRRMCPNCRAFITTSDKVCPYCDFKVGPRAIERRAPADVLGGLIPHARFTTVVILLINTGLYLAMAIRSMNSDGGSVMNLDLRTLVDFGAKFGPALQDGQWWRLITAGFLHGGVLHILMNSWVLFDLGAEVENTYGTSRYVFIYVLTTITGFYGSYLWSPNTPSIGSSAGIFGLIGAMIALGVRERSAYGAAVRSLYMRWAVYGLLLGLLPLFSVDNAAHIGGLTGGFVVGYLAGTPRLTGAGEAVWKGLAGVAIGVTIVAFALMFRNMVLGNSL